MRTVSKLRFVALVVVLTMAAAPPGLTTAATPDSEYRIGPEDVLDIAVWDNARVSRTLPVRPDGKISLPLLNDIHVAGMTPMMTYEVPLSISD